MMWIIHENEIKERAQMQKNAYSNPWQSNNKKYDDEW